MQTFLPDPNFATSAKILDYRRLGKQRVECKQILQALHFGGAWSAHPATKMWKGYEVSLGLYWLAMCDEWIDRQFNDNLRHEAVRYLISMEGQLIIHPHWLGCHRFHAAHRSNLLRKDPTFYARFGWREHPHLPYVWPDRNYVPLKQKVAHSDAVEGPGQTNPLG